MGRFFGQGDGDDEPVDILLEEIMQARAVKAAVPFAWDLALRVAGPGDNEALISLALGGVSWGGGVSNYIHPHGFRYASGLPAYTAVAEDAETLRGVIADGAESGLRGAALAPRVRFLPFVEGVVGVGGDEAG